LLYELADGPKRCCELAEITGNKRNYVWIYLKNMQKYGLVKKNEVFWELSEIGANFLNHLNIVYNNIIESQKKEERKNKNNQKKIKSSQPRITKQIPISLWLQNSGLDIVEKEVVEVLLRHYNETGSKFILVKDQFELAEKLGADPGEVVEALKNLRQDNIVYLFRSDIGGYWKVGLKRGFLRVLEEDLKAEP
jgi:DNA-binding Lrp family transcriptional regulator